MIGVRPTPKQARKAVDDGDDMAFLNNMVRKPEPGAGLALGTIRLDQVEE